MRRGIAFLALVLIAGLALGFTQPRHETNVVSDVPFTEDQIARGAIRDYHEGVAIDTCFSYICLRFDDNRADVYDSIYYRKGNAVSGSGPYPWLVGTVFCNRPETDDTCYYGGSELDGFGCTIAELKEMQAHGWEIGAHSKSHTADLTGDTDTLFHGYYALQRTIRARLGSDLRQNHEYLTSPDSAGFTNVTSFAFPNSAMCRWYQDTVMTIGYEQATSTFKSVRANHYALPYQRLLLSLTSLCPYGSIQDRYDVPVLGYTDDGEPDTRAEVLRNIKLGANFKASQVILIHELFQTYNTGTETWSKGGENANIYGDSLLAWIDSLVKDDLVRVVTFDEWCERVSGRISPGTNLICEPGDWDGDGIPDGLDWEGISPLGSQNEPPWDAQNVYADTGGVYGGPVITFDDGTSDGDPAVVWYIWTDLPADCDVVFSCAARIKPGSADDCTMTFEMESYEWYKRAGGALANGTQWTNATVAVQADNNDWQQVHIPYSIKAGCNEMMLLVYYSGATDDSDDFQISDWKLTLTDVRANYR